MKPSLSLLAASAFSALVAACSGGADVHVTDDRTGTSASASCAIEPGENVCADRAKYFTESSSNATILATDAVVAFAGLARETTASLQQACAGILSELGEPAPTSVAGALPRDRLAATCAAANAAITKAKGTARLELATESPRCVAPPSPVSACAHPDGTPLAQSSEDALKEAHAACTPRPLTVFVTGDPADIRLKHALEANLPAAFGTKARLEAMSRLVGILSGNASALAEMRAECTPRVVELAVASVAEVQASARTTANLFAAVGP